MDMNGVLWELKHAFKKTKHVENSMGKYHTNMSIFFRVTLGMAILQQSTCRGNTDIMKMVDSSG